MSNDEQTWTNMNNYEWWWTMMNDYERLWTIFKNDEQKWTMLKILTTIHYDELLWNMVHQGSLAPKNSVVEISMLVICICSSMFSAGVCRLFRNLDCAQIAVIIADSRATWEIEVLEELTLKVQPAVQPAVRAAGSRSENLEFFSSIRISELHFRSYCTNSEILSICGWSIILFGRFS